MYDSTMNAATVGAFSDRSAVRPASVTDGMSQTAFVSERILGKGVREEGVVRVVYADADAHAEDGGGDYASCQRVAPNRSIWFNQTGGAWASGEMSNTAYNHVTTPNARSCAIMDGGQMMAPWSGDDANLPWYMQVPPSSAPPGA